MRYVMRKVNIIIMHYNLCIDYTFNCIANVYLLDFMSGEEVSNPRKVLVALYKQSGHSSV